MKNPVTVFLSTVFMVLGSQGLFAQLAPPVTLNQPPADDVKRQRPQVQTTGHHVVDNVPLFGHIASMRTLPPLEWHKDEILDATFLRNGLLATLTPQGRIRIWNSQTGDLEQSLDMTEPPVIRLVATPDGSRLLGITRSGNIQQWALPAPSRAWGPEQAVGPPDSAIGDSSSAWASLSQDDQDEWLVLEYAAPVKATAIHVYENCAPGALIRVTTFGPDEKKLILWDGRDPVQTVDGQNVATLKVPEPEPVKRIKLFLDSKNVQGWNEIDAVGLEDEHGKIHWATAAGASSTFADQVQGIPADVVIPEVKMFGGIR